jgi:Domain of unknown function (DUF4167)
LINNRQAGRRRGRSGQRPQSNGGRNAEAGNRIDNRARGNAPQMLEKYKTLASEAQRQGDRVMTEYYLQFADHYFRVVAETRARFEETRRQRDDWREDEDGEAPEGEERAAFEPIDEDDEERAERLREQQRREPREPREAREQRPPRDQRPQRDFRREREDASAPREPRPPRDEGDRNDRSAPRRNDRYANDRDGNRYEAPLNEDATISIDILPPAFGPLADASDAVAEIDDIPAVPKRRGRPRKEVSDVDGDIAA